MQRRKTVVVFDKNTREVLACVPLDGSQGIMRKDIDVQVFDGTDPVFTDTQGKVLLKPNTFIVEI